MGHCTHGGQEIVCVRMTFCVGIPVQPCRIVCVCVCVCVSVCVSLFQISQWCWVNPLAYVRCWGRVLGDWAKAAGGKPSKARALHLLDRDTSQEDPGEEAAAQ